MPARTSGSGLNESPVVGAGRCNGLCSEMPGPTSTRSILARLTVIRDGIEIAVDASQQVDQDFPLVLSQAGEQPAFALKCCDDDLVMDMPSLRRQRDRVAATVARVGLDRDQSPFLHQSQRAADRALVETDHVTNARCG